MSILEDMALVHKITKQDTVSIVYKGKCLWLENTKTVARFMYVKGRLLIQVPVDDKVTWNYWHMDEFLNDWLENTKTVARFMAVEGILALIKIKLEYVKGRLLIQVPVDDKVTWNYWHMDEFLNDWDLINLQPV